MEQVAFAYPPDPKPPAPPPTPAPVATPTPAPKIDRSYAVSGDRRLTPAEVYNDGTDTYVRFAAQPQQLPTLLAIGPNGDELVNYRVVDGDQYVVAGLPAQLALVNGSGKKQQRLTITHR
jgi:type IV secretion system protein VirB9